MENEKCKQNCDWKISKEKEKWYMKVQTDAYVEWLIIACHNVQNGL
jgi:hypothetical protein